MQGSRDIPECSPEQERGYARMVGSLQEFHGEVSGDVGCAGKKESRVGRSTDRPEALASGSLSGVWSSVPPTGAEACLPAQTSGCTWQKRQSF